MDLRFFWNNGAFIRMWCAYSVSQFGSQITLFALPIIATITLNADAKAIGYLIAVETAPSLVFGLFAGVWVDRLPKKKILVFCDLLRGITLLAIPVGFLMGELKMWQLYPIGWIIGTLTLFYDIAYWSYFPSLVSKGELVGANSKMAFSRSAADSSGPAVAGMAMQLISAPLVIAINSASFVLSGIVLATLPGQGEPAERKPHVANVLHSIKDGLIEAWRNRIVRALIGRAVAWNLLFNIGNAVLVLFLVKSAALSPIEIGIVFSGVGFGYLLGASINTATVKALGLGRAVVVSVFFCAVSCCAILPITEYFPDLKVIGLTAVTVVFGCFAAIYNINQLTIRQTSVEPEMMGRINATFRFLSWGIIPLGAIAGGSFAEATSPSTAIFVTSTIGVLISGYSLVASPLLSYRTSQEPVIY